MHLLISICPVYDVLVLKSGWGSERKYYLEGQGDLVNWLVRGITRVTMSSWPSEFYGRLYQDDSSISLPHFPFNTRTALF